MEHMRDGGETVPPPKAITTVSDSLMEDLTPQEKMTDDFEEQLREIDRAINADVTIREITGIKELKKDNRVGVGSAHIEQTEVLWARMKEKTTKARLQSPVSIAPPDDPLGLANKQNEAQKGQAQMDQKVKVWDQILRSKGCDLTQKAYTPAPLLIDDNIGQNMSTQKKLPKRKKLAESRGK